MWDYGVGWTESGQESVPSLRSTGVEKNRWGEWMRLDGRHCSAYGAAAAFARASASAAVTDGAKRCCSIALTAAREIPARRASSSCDHFRRDLKEHDQAANDPLEYRRSHYRTPRRYLRLIQPNQD